MIIGGALEGDLLGRRGAKHAHCARPGRAVGQRRRDPGGCRGAPPGRRLQAEGSGRGMADHRAVAGAPRLLRQGHTPHPEAPFGCVLGPERQHGGVLLRGRRGRREGGSPHPRGHHPPRRRRGALLPRRVLYWSCSRGGTGSVERLHRDPRPRLGRSPHFHHRGRRGTHRVAHHAVLVISPYRNESILECIASSIRMVPIVIYCHFSPLSDESILRSGWQQLILPFKPTPLGV